MSHIIETNTANEAWLQARQMFFSDRGSSLQPSRGGLTREVLGITFAISNPLQRWVISRAPAMNPAFAIAEVIWILGGRNDSKFLRFWNRNLHKFAGKSANYHGAYGHRLRRNMGFDQIERAYNILSSNPESRQVVLQLWDSKRDMPWNTGSPRSKDIPCNLASLLKIRKGRLEWTQILRSNDLFLGVPYNFIQFTILQEIIAGWLGVEVGSYTHFSDSLHVYESDLINLSTFNEMEEYSNTDSLALSKLRCDTVLSEFTERITVISSMNCTEQELMELTEWQDCPQSFKNLFIIVALEAARRHRFPDAAAVLFRNCTNPALRQVWSNWSDKFDSKHQSTSFVSLRKVRDKSATQDYGI
ncbi:MAG: thymidylate synthase [candidate division Zixibacteria bacterium]|nr:thymidylate synthase [candidate division Zixibacteria bacterium]